MSTICLKFAQASTFTEAFVMASCLFVVVVPVLFKNLIRPFRTEVRNFQDVTLDGKKSKKLEKRKPLTYLFLLSIIHRVLQLHHGRRLSKRQNHACYKYTREIALRHYLALNLSLRTFAPKNFPRTYIFKTLTADRK